MVRRKHEKARRFGTSAPESAGAFEYRLDVEQHSKTAGTHVTTGNSVDMAQAESSNPAQ
jgi:hypothetical protein